MTSRACIPLILVVAAIAGSEQSASQTTGPAISGPLLIEMNPSGIAPLTGLVRFTTDSPVRVTLEIGDGEHESTVTPIDAFNTVHELMLLGLRPNRTHRVDVIFETMDGSSVSAANFSVTTEPLPHWVPPIETPVSQPERMEPGVTFFSAWNFNYEAEAFTVALDPAGDVIWFSLGELDEPRRMDNGHLLALGGTQNTITESDMLGRVIRKWQGTGTAPNVPEGVIGVATDTFHHDVTVMPSGNFLAISTEIRALEDYASEYSLDAPRGTHEVIADRIVEFRPDDGHIVRDWKLADIYDTSRPVPIPLTAFFYDVVYASVLDEPLSDWTHTNGLFYEAETDSLILSIRKMNAVVKLDLAASELIWILSTDWGWSPEFRELLLTPIGDVTFPFGQHAPKILPSGNLLIFDNGSTGRKYPGDEGFLATMQGSPESYSRAIEFEIDEDAGTVREVWAYGGPGSEYFYSEFVSEADRLPMTGNTLVHAGGQMVTADGEPTGDFEAGRVWIALKEVTSAGDKVFEAVIDDPMREWASYRAERMPSLYP